MKKLIIAMAAIAAAFTMASCNKEPLVEHELTGVTGNDIITAYTGSSLAKTSLDGDDWFGYDVVWSEGDEITIGGNTFVLTEGAGTTAGKFRGTLPTEDGTYTACYPASFNGTDWPVTQTYAEDNITGSPMKADVTVSGGKVLENSLSFKNVGGILRLTLNGSATIKYVKVKADDLDEITLNCGSGVELGRTFHIAVPKGNYSSVQISIYTPQYDYCIKKLKSGRSLQIVPSEITTATFTASFPSPTSTDPLPGEFSVASSRLVRFSRGNLRYTVASREWSFYDKQYKCGSLNNVDKEEISLFTWGYNATQSINPTGDRSDNVSIESGDLSRAQDWGSVFGDNSSWRTLTSAEWTYLLERRTDAANKYGYATVGGQKGLIILPDVFSDPMKNNGSGAFKPRSSTSASWSNNVYSLGGNWEAMETAGAVFLPAAGRRSGGSLVSSAQEQGHYWSSSADGASNANFVHFDAIYNDVRTDSWRRDNGCSVRLVTNSSFTVTFDRNEGPVEASKTIDVVLGSLIPKPANLVSLNDLVIGWYKDKACTDKWDFDSDRVTANITLYAKWEKVIMGKFTVNNQGKQVCFTRSNVWADNLNNLHFEDNQWNFNDKYESGHVSHFFWYESLSGAIRGGVPDQHGFFFCNESHKVSIEGSEKMFYTLSDIEWDYLLKKRQMKHSKPRYTANITYHGQNGLVIYEDDYISSPLSDAVDYTEDSFPFGCVFLPGAGCREGESVKPIGDSNGFYWSSTASYTPQEAELVIEPIFIQITKGDVYLSDVGDPNDGFSIRLVANIE